MANRRGMSCTLFMMAGLVACGGGDGAGTQGLDGGSGAGGSGAFAGNGGAAGSGGGAGSSAGGTSGVGGGSGGSAGTGGTGGGAGTGGAAGSAGGSGGSGAGGSSGSGGDLGAPAWLYYKEWSGSYHLVDAAKASPKAVTIPGKIDLYNHPRFSADGTRLALVVGEADVGVWSLASGAPVLEKTLTGLTDGDLYLSPPYSTGDPWLDGDRLLYAAFPSDGKKLLRVAEIGSGATETIATATVSPLSEWFVTSTGAWLAWRDGNAARVVPTTKPYTVTDLGDPVTVGFSAGGDRIALRQSSDGKLFVYKLSTATGTAVLEWSSPAAWAASSAAWAPSGARLAVQTKAPGAAVHVVDFGKAPVSSVQVASSSQTPTPLRWSESGKLLVRGTIAADSIWDATLGKDVTPPDADQQYGDDFRISPDDRWLSWKSGGQHFLTDLKSPKTVPIPATLGAFTHDSSAFIGCQYDNAVLGCVHVALASGTPVSTPPFVPQGTDALHVRSIADVHYVFSHDAVSGQHSKLFARPIVNGVVLASRQLSGPNDFVYNGFECVKCRPID